MATYYPLHHKALVWPLSTFCLLNGIPFRLAFKQSQFLKLGVLALLRMCKTETNQVNNFISTENNSTE